MHYAKVKNVAPSQMRRQIEDALAERRWSLDDLLRKLGFINLASGREQFAALFLTGKNTQLLRRVSARLEIDHETLTGERHFADYEEYLRYTFKPFLLRVPSKTRPSNIFPVAMAGLNAFLRVDTFPLLRTASESLQDKVIARSIREDYERRATITNFGEIVGYAYYYAFGKARAYAVTGERLVDGEIVSMTVGATLRTNRAALAAAGGVIPRIQNRVTGEILGDPPETNGASPAEAPPATNL